MRCTLLPSVHSSESNVGIRSYHASDPLLVFAAVKKMAPSSREATGPEVPDERPFSPPSPRGPEVPDACILSGVSWCRRLPRMRLCSSLLFKRYTFSITSEDLPKIAQKDRKSKYPWVRLVVLLALLVDLKSNYLLWVFDVNYKGFCSFGPFWADLKSKLLTFKFFFYIEKRVRVCVFAGVAVGTALVHLGGFWSWACGVCGRGPVCGRAVPSFQFLSSELLVFVFWFLVFFF